MKQYGRISLVLAVILVLVGCSRTTLEHNKSKETYLSDSLQTSSRQEEKKQETTEVKSGTTDSNTQTVNIQFDTEKPSNPETGLPPVKSITFTGNIQKKKESTHTTTSLQESMQENKESHSTIKKKSDTEAKKETKMKGGQVGLGTALLLIAGIVGFYYLYDLVRGKWHIIKQLWHK